MHADARTIVHEMFEPNYRRTIPVVNEQAMLGGRMRAVQAQFKVPLYEAHQIQYRICIDHSGLFNGSDEYAAKAAGHELRGSIAYFQAQVAGLRVPLIATIDYFGFRILAISKSPIEIPQFTDGGELRQLNMEQLLGFTDGTGPYLAKDKKLEGLLARAAERINLASHFIKGPLDNSTKEVPCSSELKVGSIQT